MTKKPKPIRKAPSLPNPFDEVLLQQARTAVRSVRRKAKGRRRG
jgi:hypothetical protein